MGEERKHDFLLANHEARIRQLESALFKCAEAAGEDVSDGAPTWPDITTWAVRAVKELRKDYGNACSELHPELVATGPQTERSGVPNPEPDGLVTVELTREEAEHAMARGEHPSNAPMIPDFSCPDCKRIAAKFRASLERTGK